MKRIWIALGLIIAIVCIVQAQIPPTPPHYSPSVPTPGVDGLRQQVEALRLEVNALNAATRSLIADLQNDINGDVDYLPSTGNTHEFTKKAWVNGVPGATDRGYAEIATLIMEAQASIDAWEVIRAGLESFIP